MLVVRTLGGPIRPEWQRERAALDRRYVCEEFRIHYTLEGPNALPDPGPLGAQSTEVPGWIQDVAVQLVTARRCYVEVIGLRHPFASPRYRARVQFVDVNVWALPGQNGLAGDAVVNYHRDNDPPAGVEVLTIDLSNRLRSANLSPAHELFHLFQNGYSLFKTPWYYEGMARWAEGLLRLGQCDAGRLPRSTADVQALFKQRYDASEFWEALARETDPQGRVPIPDQLRAMRYPTSSRPVIEDQTFAGARLLKDSLEELDRQDDLAAQQFGLNPLDWAEDRQRSPDNNPFIWAAVIAACHRQGANAPALQALPASTAGRSD